MGSLFNFSIHVFCEHFNSMGNPIFVRLLFLSSQPTDFIFQSFLLDFKKQLVFLSLCSHHLDFCFDELTLLVLLVADVLNLMKINVKSRLNCHFEEFDGSGRRHCRLVVDLHLIIMEEVDEALLNP
jgi:hypothetical protein